ncbi:MAG: zinc ABC transporter substrate-binding protein, partial [Treponema sp.]|nr:zinc ABC transporter substrate-binding protein [Treponema sp.]
YFADYYKLGYSAAFSGCSTAVETSFATIENLVKTVQEKKLSSVFYIELGNHKIADIIAEETGTKAYCLESIQNVTKDDFINGETWVSLMSRNAETLKNGL